MMVFADVCCVNWINLVAGSWQLQAHCWIFTGSPSTLRMLHSCRTEMNSVQQSLFTRSQKSAWMILHVFWGTCVVFLALTPHIPVPRLHNFQLGGPHCAGWIPCPALLTTLARSSCDIQTSPKVSQSLQRDAEFWRRKEPNKRERYIYIYINNII